MSISADAIKAALSEALSESENKTALDESLLDYLASAVQEGDNFDKDSLEETLGPFLDAYAMCSDVLTLSTVCLRLSSILQKDAKKGGGGGGGTDGDVQLLEKVVVLNEVAKNYLTESDKSAIDSMWGLEKARGRRNDNNLTFSEAASAKYERKAAKEQRAFLHELEDGGDGGGSGAGGGEERVDAESEQVTAMVMPDYSGNNREKDILVSNFNIVFKGSLLLDSAELRIVYGHRFGLVGRNGVGKTTLLKHMASFDIEGFPKHHRVLHVKQEVQSSSSTVLQTVLESDVERTKLLKREKEIVHLMGGSGNNSNSNNSSSNGNKKIDEDSSALSAELAVVYERLQMIGSHSAEARAASILSGLRFSEEMQQSSVSSLSGGWRMRVSLAAALFIEPDLLMLDEPTNHLDLEAVLWLQNYLQTYKHTVLLVSHDKTFLNEVCTDMILFKNQKLIYYRGNYDEFQRAYSEARLVQTRQREAQLAKVQHMQEFVDKFRYNAKRASLVQSRIKAIEREAVPDEVEAEDKFSFSFPDAGELGRPIIQIEGVTFGYGSKGADNPLFKDVHANIDQSSRIALVGPNGSGKSTLLKLIQGELTTLAGRLRINGQMRLGVFTQHHLDSFDLKLSALENMQKRYPSATDPELRAHLGRFELHGNDVLRPLKFTSGGQKSRVAFANLTYLNPHVIVLDEPTNHLDMTAIEALIQALKHFTGGILVVSHDQHFISSVCNEIWVLGNHTIKRLNGDINTYKSMVMKEIKDKEREARR